MQVHLAGHAAEHAHVALTLLDELVQRRLVSEREAGVVGELGVPGVAVAVTGNRTVLVLVPEERRQPQGVGQQLAVEAVVLPAQRLGVGD
jgi:hypothetical protein